MSARPSSARRRAGRSSRLTALLAVLVAAFALALPAGAALADTPPNHLPDPSTTPGVPGPGGPVTVGVPGAKADDGAYVVSETRVDTTTLDLVINSPALGKTVPVRIYLPKDWSNQPTATWPTLYLLPGCCEQYDYQSWDKFTNARLFFAQRDVLVAMPSDGPAGFFTDWVIGKAGWETFHTVELKQILERGYRAGQRRAVAGVSIGGFGAMSYAARHPGLYQAAASYSGIVNILGTGAQAIVQLIGVRESQNPWAPFGDPMLFFFNWYLHNPVSIAQNLKGIPLFFSAGDGKSGPLDPAGTTDLLEAPARGNTQDLTRTLDELHIPYTSDFYSPGTHSWPYWQNELYKSWPVLPQGLGVPAT